MNKDSQCQHCGQEWDASRDRDKLVQYVRALELEIGEPKIIVHEHSYVSEAWQLLSQEIKDMVND